MPSRSSKAAWEDPEDDDDENFRGELADDSDDEWLGSRSGNVTQSRKKTKKSASVGAAQSSGRGRNFRKKSPPPYQEERYLEDAGELRATDVLMGRGPNLCMHPGNTTFRFLCHVMRPVYSLCDRKSKSTLVEAIIGQVASLDPPGRYVEAGPDDKPAKDGGPYYIVPRGKVYEKTCQALREGKMACPPSFIRLAHEIDAARSSKVKDELYTEGTGVDPAVFARIRESIETVVATQGMGVSFMEGVAPKPSGKMAATSVKPEKVPAKPIRRPSGSGRRHSWPPTSRARPEGDEKKETSNRGERVDSNTKPAEATRSKRVKKKRVKKTPSSKLSQIKKQYVDRDCPPVVPDSTRLKKRPVSNMGETISGIQPKKMKRGKTMLPPKPSGLSSGPADTDGSSKKKRSTPKRSKKRKMAVPEGDAEERTPKRKVTKSPRHLSTSKPVAKTIAPEAPDQLDEEALAASLPPALTSFLTGIISNGGLGNNSDGSGGATDNVVQSGTSTLPPNLMSLISGMWGPSHQSHQEWLNAVARIHEGASLSSSGTAPTDLSSSASALLAPQLTSFLSGLFGDSRSDGGSGSGSDSSSSIVEAGALELPLPSLLNRLSCTYLAPVESDAFLSGGKNRALASDLSGEGASSGRDTDTSPCRIEQATIPKGEVTEVGSLSIPAFFARAGAVRGGEASEGDTKMPARSVLRNKDGGGIVFGVAVGEVEGDGAHRLAQKSPATVMQKDLGRARGGVVAGSAKSARSLLDDDDDDEEEEDDDADDENFADHGIQNGDVNDNRKKVRAARRLSLHVDLFKHDEEPL
jgi:hypothetical protein